MFARRMALLILGCVCLLMACWEADPDNRADVTVLDDLAIVPTDDNDSFGGKGPVAGLLPPILPNQTSLSCSDGVGTCDDGDPCTDDSCLDGQCVSVGNSSCAECSISSDCDDGQFCNGPERCVSGTCTSGPDPCPDLLCDETLNSCVECLGSGSCDDGDPCTENDLCSVGVCDGTPIVCDDGDPCTADLCADGVCVSAPPNCENNGDPCDPDGWANFYPLCDDCTVAINVPASIVLNCDDDNDNGIPDYQEPGPVAGENDLVPVSLSLNGCPPVPDEFPRPGDVLSWHFDEMGGNTHYKVYLDPDKTTLVDHSGAHGLWPPPSTLYLEGILATSEDCPAPLILWPSFAYTSGFCIFCGYVGGQTTVVGNQADLDVDSDNDNCSNPPDRSAAEDTVELTASGKSICLNDDDDDNNGVPDKNQEPPPVGDDDLVPMVAEIASFAPVGSRWKLFYDSSKVQVYENDRATIVPSNQVFNMALSPNPKNFWIEWITEAVTPPIEITLHVDNDGDGTFDCSDAVLVDGVLCDLINGAMFAEVVDQDDPTNAVCSNLAEHTPVYGGSEASTADNLKLLVYPTLPESVSDITWTVDGPGNASYLPPPTGPDAIEWDVGDLLDPVPGPVQFTASISYDDGHAECAEFKTEIGVRTDDMIVIGWIDPQMVTLPAVNDGLDPPTWFVNPFIAGMIQPTGLVPNSLDCNALVGDLSEGMTTLGPGGPPLSLIDRSYILNWLFKYGQDNMSPTFGPPPSDFRSNDAIDYQKVAAYREEKTRYKVFVHLQIRYLMEPEANGFKEAPAILHDKVEVGSTKNPCRGVLDWLDVVEGQTGPGTTPTAHVSPTNSRVSLIADASPDAAAVRAFDTLTAVGVAVWEVWESVGCRITFQPNGLTTPDIVLQPYPSFFEYHNGVLTSVVPQTPTTTGHFYGPGDANYPVYPFGTADCFATFANIPSSRCGDAASPAEPTARIPEYVVP